jgi:hypothetical protein
MTFTSPAPRPMINDGVAQHPADLAHRDLMPNKCALRPSRCVERPGSSKVTAGELLACLLISDPHQHPLGSPSSLAHHNRPARTRVHRRLTAAENGACRADERGSSSGWLSLATRRLLVQLGS